MAVLSPNQFAEWVEYLELEPFGFGATERRFGVLCSILGGIGGVKIEPEKFHLEKKAPEVVDDFDVLKRLLGGSRTEPEESDDLAVLKKLLPGSSTAEGKL